jgi:hypothetical protein
MRLLIAAVLIAGLLAACASRPVEKRLNESWDTVKQLCEETRGSWEDAPPMICAFNQRGEEVYCNWQQWCRCPRPRVFIDGKGCFPPPISCPESYDCRSPFSLGDQRYCVGEFHGLLETRCGTAFLLDP